MKLRQIAATTAALASVAAGVVVSAPAAEAYTKPCRPGQWCVYRNPGYGIEIASPGARGTFRWSPVVARSDYDKASSFINNTGKRVCLYSFRGGNSRVADLILTVRPYQDIRTFSRATNDKIDAYYSTYNATCARTSTF